ncbi:hypothetical protein BH10PSE12_BH10PSE12_37910 [soil metagenome]
MRPDTANGNKAIGSKMKPDKTENGAHDPQTLALLALGWLLSDERRAERLLALTGLDAQALRAGVGDSGVLDAILGFLEGHEPDLIACAEAIDCRPQALIAARQALNA